MNLRENNLRRLTAEQFDVLVLGGGINGAVAAAALSARGAKVGLIDRGDFASETSQQSSNLAWGGIKYLETFEFGLVRKLCMARNRLLRAYPSIVQEIRFFTMHPRGFRHGLLKLLSGTFFYWLIGNFFTRRPRGLSLEDIAREEPIVRLEGSDGGFEYSDAYLHDNDARFVWGFIRSAMDYGCAAANYAESLGGKRENGIWTLQVRDLIGGATFPVRARAVVNACGPWADAHNLKTGEQTGHRHVFSKGIHLIVDRLTPHRRVLTFFADDGRLFFVIPMGPRTCIGTTDTRVEQPEVQVTAEDRKFVLDNINKRLKLDTPLTNADIIAERCGVRPLVVPSSGEGGQKDWTQLSRKHVIEKDAAAQHLTIFGGKLTDCLNVGEEVCDCLQQLGISLPFPERRWYGEPDASVRDDYFHQARLMNLDSLTSPRSSEQLSTRLWRRYGARAAEILENIRADPSMADLLIENAEYIRAEIDHTARREMITRLSDFLRRRSKIELVVRREDILRAPGLHAACRIFFGGEAEAKLAEYAGSLPPAPPAGESAVPQRVAAAAGQP